MRLSDVHGHSELKAKIVKNYKQGRLPHAQLLLGPEGCGNLSLALAITQLIYCKNATETDSCGICSSCIKIQKHSHPDVHFTYPTAGAKQISTQYMAQWREMLNENINLSVEDWIAQIADDENKKPNITREESRDILNRLSLKPFEGDAKTLIIWMPEYLSEVGNSLLKILEEPPQKTYFILVAHNFDALLSTITSRTQLIKVPAYSNEEIVSFLTETYKLENSQAQNMAFLAEGNIRLAHDLVESKENNYSELFRNWMLACFTNNLSEVGKICDELAKLGRVQTQLFLKNGLKILRETLLYKTIEDYDIKFQDNQQAFITNLAKTLNAKYIEDSYVAINDVIYHIMRNANAKISLFNLSLTLRHNFIRTR